MSHKLIDTHLPTIKSMGNLLFDPMWSEGHTSGNCELMHVISGQVTIVMRNQRIAAKTGDTVLVPSQTSHRDDFDLGSKLEVFMVHFSWSWEKDFFSLVPASSLPGLSEAAKETVARLVQRLRVGFAAHPAQDDLLVRTRLAEILITLLELSLDQARQQQEPAPRTAYGKRRREWLLTHAKSYIEGNYQRAISLDDIAKHLRVSPYHLSHVFSSESDFSLFEFLTQLRMKKARSLLEEGTLTIAEIAYAVGFNNSNYFTKVFHRFHGFPPAQLHRRQLRTRKG